MRIEPDRSITRATSRGRSTAWAAVVMVGRNCSPKTLLKALGKVSAVIVVATAV